MQELGDKLSGRQKTFGRELIEYIQNVWINGHYEPSTWNQFERNAIATNNFNEAYNYRLGSKKEISRHPNPYLLVQVIKSELKRASDVALSAQLGKGVKQKKKYARLQEKKDKMMKNLKNRDIDLRTYMCGIGYLTMRADKRIKNLDVPASQEPEATCESQESQDEPEESTIVNGTTQSSDPRLSLAGAQLRDMRNIIMNPDQTGNEDIFQESAKLTLEQGAVFVKNRLDEAGFQLSESQPNTPKDGNCLVHAVRDQMLADPKLKTIAQAKDHGQLRAMVVHQLPLLEATGKISWPGHQPMDQWIGTMLNDATFCDHIFLQLTAEVFNRELVLVPIFQDGHADGQIKFQPSTGMPHDFNPFYFLYFSESRFVNPHYQSIQRKETCLVNGHSDSSLVHEDNQVQLLASIPDISSEMSPPTCESTKNNTRNKRKQNSREMSYLSTTNIVSGKRSRKN